MKKHIPNALTCCNLLCGCCATYVAFRGNYPAAALWIVLGAAFDFFDGFAARLLGVSSAIGKELDSLADDITFGFAPAAVAFSLLRDVLPHSFGMVSYVAFLIAAFSALRLAKFNLDERQSLGFIGLPTPANALFWSSLAVSAPEWLLNAPFVWAFFVVLIGLSCWLLVSEVPMFALKFKTYGFEGNEVRYAFIAASALLLLLLGVGGFTVVIPAYILVSLFTAKPAATGSQMPHPVLSPMPPVPPAPPVSSSNEASAEAPSAASPSVNNRTE